MSTQVDLKAQVQGVLEAIHGGTGNAYGAADKWLLVRVFNDSGSTISAGSVVTKDSVDYKIHKASIAGQPVVGVLVGYFPDAGGPLVLGSCATGSVAAVAIAGLVYVDSTNAGTPGQYVAASATAGKVTCATAKPQGAFGIVWQAGDSSHVFALIGAIEAQGALAFGTPSLTLSTTNSAGASTSLIRADATIAVFDATDPAAEALGATALTGSAGVAARRDHRHPVTDTYDDPAIVLGTVAAGGTGTKVIRHNSTIVAFDTTTPVTQALGDAAATGSAAVAARRDHKHGMPSNAVGELLISDTPSTPLIFADLVQNEAQDDLLYSD